METGGANQGGAEQSNLEGREERKKCKTTTQKAQLKKAQ